MEDNLENIKKAFMLENSIIQTAIFCLLFFIFLALSFEYYYLSNFFFILINTMVLGISIGAFFLIKKRRKFLILSNKARGEIISFNDKKKHYGISCPMVLFNYNDVAYQFENEVYEKSFNQAYLKDDNVEVLFDIENPHDAIINSRYSIWSKPLSMVLITIGTVAIDLYMMR